jgi:hypothetical protein
MLEATTSSRSGRSGIVCSIFDSLYPIHVLLCTPLGLGLVRNMRLLIHGQRSATAAVLSIVLSSTVTTVAWRNDQPQNGKVLSSANNLTSHIYPSPLPHTPFILHISVHFVDLLDLLHLFWPCCQKHCRVFPSKRHNIY